VEELRGTVRFQCPKCRAAVTGMDIICVPCSRFSDITEERWEEQAEVRGGTGREEVPRNPKLETLVRIVRGDRPERKAVGNPLPGLLEGRTSLGAPSDRKFLVFANHEEMLGQICARLEGEGIAFRVLRGTTAQMNEIIDRYRLPSSDKRSLRILLVNGVQYCAGMNLQCTTDLIFAHWVCARNVACQIGGRAARHGRTSDLSIHYLLYKNEEEAFERALA
jgi:hypothetical protein